VPDTASGDTFLINHPIVIDNDLRLESGAYMLIQNGGGICGHQIATVLGNAKLVVYGILELDELYVNSGFVRIYKGDVTLTTYAQITGQGGNLKVEEEASLVVGEWFECRLPDYSFARTSTAVVVPQIVNRSISIYPNPFTNALTIENLQGLYSDFKVYNLLGEEVFSSLMHSNEPNTFNLNHLKKGVYILTVFADDTKYSFKIVKN